MAVVDVDAAGAVVVADFGNALVVAVADVADVPPVDDYFDSKSCCTGAVADSVAVAVRGNSAVDTVVDFADVAAAIADNSAAVAVADDAVDVAAVAKAVVAVGNFGDIHQRLEESELRREELAAASFSALLPPSFSSRQRPGLAAVAEKQLSYAADLPPAYAESPHRRPSSSFPQQPALAVAVAATPPSCAIDPPPAYV